MTAYFDCGFSVREPMWHGLGTVLDAYPESWDDARMAAGLMWEPAEQPVWRRQLILAGGDVPEGSVLAESFADGSAQWFVKLDSFKIVERDDTREVLDVAHIDRGLITHASMGELLDAYTEGWRKSGAKVQFETAGVLKGGRSVYALVRLDEPFTINGDDSATYPFAALLNSHDGSGACKLLPTNIRVVCWNTFSMASALGERTGHQVVLRHTKNVGERIEEAKATLASMRDEAKAWQLLANDLAAINVSDAVVQTFLQEFIPIPENTTERIRNSRAERQAVFMGLYNESPTTDAIRGTAYGLVQTAGEYLDHIRPFQSADTYLARTLLSAEPIKAGVVKLVRELATAAA